MAKRWTALATIAASLTVLPATPTLADSPAWTTTVVDHAGAAISGPLEGGDGDFFFVLEAFAFVKMARAGRPSQLMRRSGLWNA